MKESIAAFIFGSLVLWHTALADDPLACLDPDVVRTLLATPAEGSIEITRERAAGFPRIALPAEFELIGSRVSSFASMIALKSSLPIEETKTRVEQLVTRSGWERFGELTQGNGGGFQSRGRIPTSASMPESMTFCSDVQGNLTIALARSPSGGSYVTLWAPLRESPNPCQSYRNAERLEAGQSHQLPALYLPEDGIGYPDGGGRGPNSETSTAYLKSDRTIPALLDFFARQLADQDWRQEGQWSDPILSGSAWLSQDQSTSGLLTIIQQGSNHYRLTFAAMSLK